MYALFVAIYVLGFVFFLVSRRRFDLFSLAYFSSCFYFFPGVVGFVQMPTGDGTLPMETTLSDPTYGVMTFVLAGIIVAGVAAGKSPMLDASSRSSRSHDLAMTQWIAAAGALAGFLLVLLDPRTVWSADKSEVLASLSRSSILMSTSATIAAVLVVRTRRLAPVILAFPALIADVLRGFRATIILAIIAAIIVWLNGKSLRNTLRRRGVLLASTAGISVLIFVLWQQFYLPFRESNWSEVESRARTGGTYVEAVKNAEPFVTQAILERVVEEDYKVRPDHLLVVFAVIVPYYTEWFSPPIGFNDRFQPDLFPEVLRYGLANNIWAEAWAIGRMPMVVAYVLLWSGVLWLGSWCLRSESEHLVVLGGICGSYAAFYVHRNDLLYQAILERRFVLGYLAAAGLAWLIHRVAPSQGASDVGPA